MDVDDLKLMVGQLASKRARGLPDRSCDIYLTNEEIADLIDFAAGLAGLNQGADA